MAINVVVSVQYNGGFLPWILLTQCYYHRAGNPFKCHEEVLYLQPMIPPKSFDVFRLGCSEGLVVVVVVVLTLKAVPISTQYFLTSVLLVQLTRRPSVVTGYNYPPERVPGTHCEKIKNKK